MRLTILVLILCFTAPFSSSAQTIFMKITGVDGDATEKGFEKHFKILAFEQSGENKTTFGITRGGTGAVRVNYNTIKIKKLLTPAANPAIMSRLSKATLVDSILFTWTRQTGEGLLKYYQVKLTNFF